MVLSVGEISGGRTIITKFIPERNSVILNLEILLLMAMTRLSFLCGCLIESILLRFLYGYDGHRLINPVNKS